MSDPPVVITEIGVISPVGLDLPTMWDTLCAVRPCIAPISLFNTETFEVRIAGEAYGSDPLLVVSAREARRSDRMAHFTLAVREQAPAPAVAQALRVALGDHARRVAVRPPPSPRPVHPPADAASRPHPPDHQLGRPSAGLRPGRRATSDAANGDEVVLSNWIGFGTHGSRLVLPAWRERRHAKHT